MNIVRSSVCVLGVTLVASCAAEQPTRDPFDAADGEVEHGTTHSHATSHDDTETAAGDSSRDDSGPGASETSEPAPTGTSASESAGVRLDIAVPETTNVSGDDGGCSPSPDQTCGCTAVDILFVIDNSDSMQPYQDGLATAFPAFVQAMITSLPHGTDLHVGITSTSFGDPNAGGAAIGDDTCSYNALDAMALNHYPPPSQPNGQNGGQGRLYEYDGLRYYSMKTDQDPSGLEQWFSGAAVSVGDQGSNWEMMAAGGAWVAHPDNSAFNDGFLRDAGAVLVVFVLTDELDNSPEDVAVYHDLVVSAKASCGGDTCVVTGGLVPDCLPNASTNVLQQFLSSFGDVPTWGPIGTPGDSSHYAGVLANTLAQVIGETCDRIEPEG